MTTTRWPHQGDAEPIQTSEPIPPHHLRHDNTHAPTAGLLDYRDIELDAA